MAEREADYSPRNIPVQPEGSSHLDQIKLNYSTFLLISAGNLDLRFHEPVKFEIFKNLQ